MPPCFSIIIPVYNVAPYLRECLDSVLAQTFTDWEAVCVDDGSTDGSGAILDEYAQRDNRFKVIHQTNAGVSAARNVALDVWSGEWLLFLDADDIIGQASLSILKEVICNHPAERLVKFGYMQFADGHQDVQLSNVCDKVLVKNISNGLGMSDFYTLATQCAYKRDVVIGMKFKKYMRGEDRVFLDYILLNRVDSLVDVDATLYGYRQRATSAVHVEPGFQAIVDELEHRRDIVLMIENSSKKVIYGGSWWLEGYFTHMVGGLIAKKPRGERKELWKIWFSCVKEMRGLEGLSNSTKVVYFICCALHWQPVWWIMCRAKPWCTAYGIIPRAYRKLKRQLKNT